MGEALALDASMVVEWFKKGEELEREALRGGGVHALTAGALTLILAIFVAPLITPLTQALLMGRLDPRRGAQSPPSLSARRLSPIPVTSITRMIKTY